MVSASSAPNLESIVVNGTDPSKLTVDVLNAQRLGGVNVWVGSCAVEFGESYAFIAKNSDHIVPALSVHDIRAAHRRGKISYVFHWQDAGALEADSPYTGPVLNRLDECYALGLRICGIAYNNANCFGGGCLDPHIGLTRNGRELVKRIHDLKIVLDVGGHTGEQASLDAIAMAPEVPVICSHTNCKSITDNLRNTSDRVIEAIAKTGGVIGVTAHNDLNARETKDKDAAQTLQAGIAKVLDHLDHLKHVVGVDHIGVSPDFVVGWSESDAWPSSNAPLSPNGSASLRPPEVYSDGPDVYVKNFETIDELPNVWTGLAERGWSTEDIDKVRGKNWLRVYEAIWGE